MSYFLKRRKPQDTRQLDYSGDILLSSIP